MKSRLRLHVKRGIVGNRSVRFVVEVALIFSVRFPSVCDGDRSGQRAAVEVAEWTRGVPGAQLCVSV